MAVSQKMRTFAQTILELLMTKRLLILSLVTVFSLTAPLAASVSDAEAFAVEQTIDDEVVIAVEGQSVTITGAQGQTLEVVSLTGRRVMTVKIDSPAQRIELNIPKGCYILKVGKVVRKVSVH